MDPQAITLIIISVAIILLLTGWLRSDLVALLVVVALGVTGVLTAQEAFSGFSRSAVITILAVFVLTEGLNRVGISDKIGELLIRLAGTQERSLVLGIMAAGALLSLFMNNIAAASVLLPAVSGAAQRAKINQSHLLMPLGFATILGGMATLLTTTNIVVSSLLRDHGLIGFGLLDFAPIGLPLVLIGILYMTLWGRNRIHAQPPNEQLQVIQKNEENLIEVYRLGERLRMAKLPKGSPLAGVTLEQSELRQKFSLNVVAIQHQDAFLPAPSPTTILQVDDILVVEAQPQAMLSSEFSGILEWLPPPDSWDESEIASNDVLLIETVLAPRSVLVGETLRSVHFREKYGMNVIAIWRMGRPLRTGLSDILLQFGDALLLQGPLNRLPLLRASSEIITLTREWEAFGTPRKAKSWVALITMLITLVIAASGWLPVGEVMLGGALVMVIAGILSMDQAYQAIEWKSIFLVAGMLPLGIAMTKTGTAASLGNVVEKIPGVTHPLVLLALLMLAAILLTQVMNGASVAAVITPIAIVTAQHAGVNPRTLAMGIALATSMAFITPLGHPVNILIMGPGGYRFRDFFIVGLPLTLLLYGFVVIFLPFIVR